MVFNLMNVGEFYLFEFFFPRFFFLTEEVFFPRLMMLVLLYDFKLVHFI